jgi:hypothetical protein
MQILLGAAAISGMVAGIALFSAWDIYIDDPQVVAIERARCAAEVEAAAARATAAEQLRQFRIGETAFQQAYVQDQEDRAWHDAQVDQLEAEIRDYGQQRGNEGRACPLDDRDLVFLGADRAGRLQQHGAAD